MPKNKTKKGAVNPQLWMLSDGKQDQSIEHRKWAVEQAIQCLGMVGDAKLLTDYAAKVYAFIISGSPKSRGSR